jgi:hypothetical protein
VFLRLPDKLFRQKFVSKFMRIENVLDDLHVALTMLWWTQLFTVVTRCLLAVGFIPPSYVKIMHRPFTVLPDSDPVGHYFNALYQTGFYYEFLGWGQMIAAVLLLIPRTAHIGAVMFLPIIVNIAVLTSAVGFRGTWLITILMTLAAVYLVAWEYDRLKPLLFYGREQKTRRFGRFELLYIPLLFAAGGAVMSVLWWSIRLGNFANYFYVGMMLTIAGAVFGVIVALHYRYMRVGRLTEPPAVL